MDNIQLAIVNVERVAKANGMTIGEVCAAVDINPSTWRRWRNGTVSPTMRSWQPVQAFMSTLPDRD